MSRIRYHSDCDYFAGCESMLVNFFADEGLGEERRMSFSYRPSRDYDRGLRERVADLPELRPLPLVDFHQVSGVSNGWPAALRGLYKALLRLVLAKYWVALWDAALLYRSLGPEPVDVLHINNGGWPGAVSCHAAAVAGRLRGVKRIVHVVNNMAVPYDRPDRWLDWPLDRLGARCVDVFVTGSEGARRRLVEVLGLPEGRAVSMPNGLAPRALTEEPASVRRRLGVAAGRGLLAVGAVLEARKGHRVLLEALSRMKKGRLAPMPLVALAGDGPCRGELERLARESGLHDDVRFLGWISAPLDLLNAADIVVLPSIADEDFPNVVLEAMSLGKAVVATRVGGVEEQIVDGDSGLVVVPGDAEGLANAVSALCADEALRTRLGSGARARFEGRFTARVAVGRYQQLYRSLSA